MQFPQRLVSGFAPWSWPVGLSAIPFTMVVAACGDRLPEGRGESDRPAAAVSPARRPIGTVVDAASMPAESLGMRGMERYALAIARALEDSATRIQLAKAMRDSANAPLGIDLTACDRRSTASALFRVAERLGGDDAAPLCTELRARGRFVLYMDRAKLATWKESSAVPWVTVLADPRAAIPEELMAYQSPTRLVSLGGAHRFPSPVFVVLPYSHPSQKGAP